MSKTKTVSNVKIHPAAELFPMMDDVEYGRLLEDVRDSGIKTPLLFLNDELIDGRNRLKALQELGRNPHEHKHTYSDEQVPDPVGFVLSLNLHRRHLNESQRAMLASKVATMRAGRQSNTAIAVLSQEAAAETLHVSVDSVQRARKVINKAVQEIVDAVEHGDVSVSAAAEVSELPKSQQKKLAKAGAKAVAAAAAKSRKDKADAKPAKKSSFEPEGFDPAMKDGSVSKPDEPLPTKVPAHLKDVISGVKLGQSLVRDIQMVMRNAKSYVETPAGAWLAVKWSNYERDIKQIEMDAKLTLFECNCPNCKNKVTKACGKCGGRGWIDRRHASMLTNDEKKWVEDNK